MASLARWLGIHPGVVALSSARFLDALSNSFVIIVLTRTVDEIPLEVLPLPENTRLGVLISGFGLMLAGSQPIFGRLQDRLARLNPLILGGLTFFTLATLGLHYATAYWQVLVLRGLQGITLAATVPTSMSCIARLTHPDRRGTAMGFYGTTRLSGFALGPLIAGWVLLIASPTDAYLVAAVPGAIGLAIVALFVPTVRQEHDASSPGGVRSAEADAEPHRADFRFHLLGAVFFVTATTLVLLAALEQEFTDRLGLDAFEFGVAFSVLIAARIFLDVPIGRLSDRWGRKGFVVVGLLLLGPSTLLTAYATSFAELVAYRLLMGVAVALLTSPTFALAADWLAGRRSGRHMAVVTAGFGLGLGIGPLVSALLVDLASFPVPFLLFGLMAMVLAPVVALVVEEPARETPVEPPDEAAHGEEG